MLLQSQNSFHHTHHDDEDDEDEEDDEDSSSDSSLCSSISAGSSSLSFSSATPSGYPSLSSSASSASSSTSINLTPPVPRSRKHIKTSLGIFQTRRALLNRAWQDLWNGLQALKPDPVAQLGIFLPVLARLSTDVDALLEEQAPEERDYRKSLSSAEAKARAVLAQKWPKILLEPGWRSVRETVQTVPKPDVISGSLDLATSHLLAFIESILLLGSPRKLSLARLGLTCLPRALIELEAVLAWYLRFDEPLSFGRTGELLRSIKSLDLSRNNLVALPDSLSNLLPHLENLDLAHNSFVALPTCLTQFRNLSRLNAKAATRRRKGNVRAIWAAIAAQGHEVWDPPEPVPPLTVFCIRQLQHSSVSLRGLATHLRAAVETGYDCESCGRFVYPGGLGSIYERVRLLSPGVNLPRAAESWRRRGAGTVEVLNVLGATVAPYGLSPAERVAVAVGSQAREGSAAVVVIGPRRLCARCAKLHLSFEPSGDGGSRQLRMDEEECGCVGCVEERTVVTEVGIVRWVRRKVPRQKGSIM